MSRLGKRPIALPEKVKVSVTNGGHIVVEGPKGKLEWDLPQGISVNVEDKQLVVVRPDDTRKSKALHGLARSLISNMATGVSSGFKKDLEIHGVGFRANVQGSKLNLSLGFSHPVLYEIPEGIKIAVTDNTKISIEGIDKQLVGQVAANIRVNYPPEPYKGKGIRFAGEHLRRKEGKTVQ